MSSEKRDLLPSSSPAPRPASAKWRRATALTLVTVGSLYLASLHHPFNLSTSTSVDLSKVCVQPTTPGTPSKYSLHFDDPEAQMMAANRLSKAVTFPTQTFDTMPPPSLDHPIWKPFTNFRAWLATEYPEVHARGTLELYEEHAMLFTFKAKDMSLKPVFLTAHMDVVPAVTSLDRWTHPPFDGVIADGMIYGRGSGDCKNNLIALMTSLEHLFSQPDFELERPLLVAFGADEERGGYLGAKAIGKALDGRMGKNSVAMLIDEGGLGISELYGATFALPSLAEKGSGNFVIEVDTPGGHSSVPQKYSSIGLLSKIISALEDKEDLFKPILKEASPLWGYMQCIAKYGESSLVPSWMMETITKAKPDFAKIANNFASGGLKERYLVQTSKVVTLLTGGHKVNALPESATATFNSRIDFFSDPEEAAATYMTVVSEVASKYKLSIDGKDYDPKTFLGNVSLTYWNPEQPSPLTKSGTDAYALLASAVQATYGADVITSPMGALGNTDTKHYLNLSENIYRFTPVRNNPKLENIHTVDEMMSIEAHVEAIQFYINFLTQAQEATI